MNNQDHLTDDLLVRDLDEELSPSEAAVVDAHLASCAGCKQRYQEWSALSINVGSAFEELATDGVPAHRHALDRALSAGARAGGPNAATVVQRFGWAVGLAAALIVGLLLWPQMRNKGEISSQSSAARAGVQDFGDTLELNGETFTRLPYSNPDLPLGGVHVVRTRIPMASLAAAGVRVEPISYEVSVPDRSVAADVLFGMDGQPLGVHIFNEE